MCANSSIHDLVFSWAFLFAFFLFVHISNLAPASVGSFDPTKHLCRGDIAGTRFGLLISFKWSKTNQTDVKSLKLPLYSGSCFMSGSRISSECVLVCLRPPRHPPFSRPIVQVLTLLFLNHSLFRFSELAWRVWVFPTPLGLEDTPNFIMVSLVNSFRFTVTGHQTPINVILSFLMLLSSR